MKPTNIAFFPGTFDPIHFSHIDIARRARNQYKFKKVVFVTFNNQPHKKNKDLTSIKDRFNMINLAIKPYKYLDNLAIEFKEGVTASMTEIVKLIKDMYKLDRVNLILGDDSFVYYNFWNKPQEAANNSRFFVNQRYFHINVIKQDQLAKLVSTISYSIHNMLSKLKQDVRTLSSRDARLKPMTKEGLSHIVPKGAVDYIYQNNLYNKRTITAKKQTDIFAPIPPLYEYEQAKFNPKKFPEVQRIIVKDVIQN